MKLVKVASASAWPRTVSGNSSPTMSQEMGPNDTCSQPPRATNRVRQDCAAQVAWCGSCHGLCTVPRPAGPGETLLWAPQAQRSLLWAAQAQRSLLWAAQAQRSR